MTKHLTSSKSNKEFSKYLNNLHNRCKFFEMTMEKLGIRRLKDMDYEQLREYHFLYHQIKLFNMMNEYHNNEIEDLKKFFKDILGAENILKNKEIEDEIEQRYKDNERKALLNNLDIPLEKSDVFESAPDVFDQMEKRIKANQDLANRQAREEILLTLRHSEKVVWRNHLRGLTKQAIADRLGKHYRSVHRTIRRIEEKMDELEQKILETSVI